MQTMRKLRADSAKLFLGWTDNSTELWQNISRKISLTTESIGTTILCTLFGYKHIKVLPKIYNSQTLLACNHTVLYLAFYSKLCSKVLWGWIIFYLRDFKSSYYHSRPRLLPKFWCNYLTDEGVCCSQKRFAVMIPGVQYPKYAGHVHRDARRRRNKTLPNAFNGKGRKKWFLTDSKTVSPFDQKTNSSLKQTTNAQHIPFKNIY